MFQPMSVRDLAQVIRLAIERGPEDGVFEVGGPETIEYNDMMRETLAARGKKGVLFHAPIFLVKPVVPVIEAVMPKLLTKDQLTMLLEGSHTSDTRIHELGGFALTTFQSGNAKLHPIATTALGGGNVAVHN